MLIHISCPRASTTTYKNVAIELDNDIFCRIIDTHLTTVQYLPNNFYSVDKGQNM